MTSHDIVVVGHGAAGLAAAIAARQEASRLQLDANVLVIERTSAEESGGNTRWSPSYMRMASTQEIAPGFEQDLLAVSAGRADRDYMHTLAAQAPQTVQWVAELGVDFHRPVYYLAEGPPRIQPVGGGVALLQGLTDAARAHGVRFRYECTARSLACHGTAVGGLEATNASGTVESIPAGAVVLASGGFAGDPQMLREHFGDGAESMRLISPGTRFGAGEGIRMAVAIGARRSGDWQGMHAEPVDARSQRSAPVVLVYPYGIVVDDSGRRFFDEGAGLVHETWETFARQMQFKVPGRRAFAILDSKLFDIAGYERAIRSELPPLQADSIEQLAAMTGVDMAGLRATLDDYNRAATGDATRFDATRIDGLRAAQWLAPPKSNWARAIDRPPYLAYPLVGAIAYTFGGIDTNSRGEVRVDAARARDGDVPIIPGLYAAGEITGHFYGLAPNAIAVMRALVFGRIAGTQAARYVASLRAAR